MSISRSNCIYFGFLNFRKNISQEIYWSFVGVRGAHPWRTKKSEYPWSRHNEMQAVIFVEKWTPVDTDFYELNG